MARKKQKKRFKPKYHIKKGDIVMVISGESKGVEGRVLKVETAKGRAIVEGANVITRHTKPNSRFPDGGRIEKEAPIHISNLMYVDKSGEPTRIGRKVVDGKNVRYSKKTGEVIK